MSQRVRDRQRITDRKRQIEREKENNIQTNRERKRQTLIGR